MQYIRILSLAVHCFGSPQVIAAERWFDQALVNSGNRLFQEHCAQCHGPNAEVTRDWKQTDANDNYPPPLDGSAHAWHHSIPQLLRSIKQGGIRLGGVMPGFENKLSDEQLLAVIAYSQSEWPAPVYQAWHQRFMQ